jgi:predicted membrane protein
MQAFHLEHWLFSGFLAGVLLGGFMNPMRVINLAAVCGVSAFAAMCFWPDAFGGRGAEVFGSFVMAVPAWGGATAVGALISYPTVRQLRKKGYLRIRKRARFMQEPGETPAFRPAASPQRSQPMAVRKPASRLAR